MWPWHAKLQDHKTSPKVRQHCHASQNLANGAMLLLVGKSIHVKVCQKIYLLNVSLALLANKTELNFDLNSLIGKENSIMFKDSMSWILCAFGNVRHIEFRLFWIYLFLWQFERKAKVINMRVLYITYFCDCTSRKAYEFPKTQWYFPACVYQGCNKDLIVATTSW